MQKNRNIAISLSHPARTAHSKRTGCTESQKAKKEWITHCMYTQAKPIAARASLRLVKQTFVTHNKSQGPLLNELIVLISFVPKFQTSPSLTAQVVT